MLVLQGAAKTFSCGPLVAVLVMAAHICIQPCVAATTPFYFYVASPAAQLSTCSTSCNSTRSGAYPATVLSAQQNAALYAALPNGLRAIIGGTRYVGNNSMFRWVTGPLGLEDGGLGRVFFNGTTRATGVCVAGAYCNWNGPQPDNSDGDEGVVEIRSNLAGAWNDVSATFGSTDGCLCQKEVTMTASVSNALSSSESLTNTASATNHSSRTLSLGEPSSTAGRGFEVWYIPLYGEVFLQCIDLCRQSRHGGYLATPRNANENEQLRRAIPDANAEVFIGGSRNVGDRLSYRWVSGPLGQEDNGQGAIFYDSYITGGNCVAPYYCNFNTGEPNNYSIGPQALTGEYWIVMFQSSGAWNDDYIGDGCLCQRPLATMVPTVSLHFSVSATEQPSASLTRSTTQTPTEDVSKSLTPPPTPTPTRSQSSSFSHSGPTPSLTRSPSQSVTHQTQLLTSSLTVSLSPTHTDSRTRSILQSETLRDPGVAMINQSVRGLLLSIPAPSGLWNESFVIAELQLIGTEFSPFFNRSEVNCFANVSDALVEMPMDGDAGRTVRAFVAQTTVVRVVSDTRALVYLQASSGVYSTLARRTVIGIGLRGACLARSYLTIHGELNVEATLSDPASSDILKNTGTVSTVVAVINPVVAVQAQRNSLALSIQYCEADDSNIGILRSPTTLALGDSSVSSYVGGAAMNHVVVFGMIVVMGCIAWVRQLGVGGSLIDALSIIRCPGPLAFPILILIEPTATCAIVTILFAEGRLVVIGYVSLLLCVTYPVVMLAYLLRGFKAERLQEIEPVMVGDDAGGGRVERFMFGSGKWIDDPTIPGSKGFCRRNAYFFKEYRQGRHWFLSVEVVLSVSIGSLEGIKLGYGQCQGVLYAMTSLLGVYMIAFFLLRPCVSAFSNLYVLVLTAMQLTGCLLLCLPHDAKRTTAATDLSAVGSYIVLAKSAVDVCELVVFSMRSCKKWRDHREARLLAVAAAHANIDAIAAIEVPASLLKQPISILARHARELGARYPMVAESGILDLLGADMYGRRGEVLGALEVVCGDNVRSMKTQAAHKEALDGVWRDWRGEGLRVPIELVALAVQLREVESTLRASEASRVTFRGLEDDVAGVKSGAHVAVKSAKDEEVELLEDYLEPLIVEDDEFAFEEYDDAIEMEELAYSPGNKSAVVSSPEFALPDDAPARRPSIYGINADGYLVVEDDADALARDAEYFPEIDFR